METAEFRAKRLKFSNVLPANIFKTAIIFKRFEFKFTGFILKFATLFDAAAVRLAASPV